MIKGLLPVGLALVLVCTGCAGRMGVQPADVTPTAVPQSTPPPPPKPKPAAPAPPATGTGSQDRKAAAATSVPPPAAPPAAAGKAPAGGAPPATASTYVYPPQQAVSAAPAPTKSATPDGTPAPAKDAAPALPAGELQLLVVASANQVAAEELVTVDVMASSSAAVVDAPLHLSFDPQVLAFVDAAIGDFLTQGGSSVVFLADGQSRPGDVAIAAGRVSREQGASGSGLLCRVRFRGVRAGTTAVSVGQAKAWGTTGEVLTVRSSGTSVVVR